MAGFCGWCMFNSFKKLPTVVRRGCTSLHCNSKELGPWAQQIANYERKGRYSSVLWQNPSSPRASG